MDMHLQVGFGADAIEPTINHVIICTRAYE